MRTESEQSLSTIETRNRQPKRVFVEVGCGKIPAPALGTKEISDDQIYIGIDLDKNNVDMAPYSLLDQKIEKGNIHFIQADGQKLPIPNNSIDEIYFGDVLSSGFSVTDDVRKRLIQEAHRVLRKNGDIIIKEIIGGETVLPISTLSLILSQNGFKVEKIVKASDARWKDEISPYESPDGCAFEIPKDGYLLFAQKVDE